MKKIITTFSLLLIASIGFSQVAAEEGTYQLIQNKKSGDVFTTDLLHFIEENRHDTREMIISLTEHTQVRILSKERINSLSFIPLSIQIVDKVDYDYMQNYIIESESKYKNYTSKNKKKNKKK